MREKVQKQQGEEGGESYLSSSFKREKVSLTTNSPQGEPCPSMQRTRRKMSKIKVRVHPFQTEYSYMADTASVLPISEGTVPNLDAEQSNTNICAIKTPRRKSTAKAMRSRLYEAMQLYNIDRDADKFSISKAPTQKPRKKRRIKR